MSNRLVKSGLLCGLLAPLLWAAAIVVCGRLQPDFDHVDDYISELAAQGSPTAMLMRYGGFVATGVMHIVFAGAFLADRRRRQPWPWLLAGLIALNGAGRIGAGVLPCDPGCIAVSATQQWHSLAATVGFLALIAATLLAAASFRRDRRLRPLAVWSLLSGIAALACLALMQAGNSPGLWERLASGLLSTWIFVVAARLSVGRDPSDDGLSDRPAGARSSAARKSTPASSGRSPIP